MRLSARRGPKAGTHLERIGSRILMTLISDWRRRSFVVYIFCSVIRSWSWRLTTIWKVCGIDRRFLQGGRHCRLEGWKGASQGLWFWLTPFCSRWRMWTSEHYLHLILGDKRMSLFGFWWWRGQVVKLWDFQTLRRGIQRFATFLIKDSIFRDVSEANAWELVRRKPISSSNGIKRSNRWKGGEVGRCRTLDAAKSRNEVWLLSSPLISTSTENARESTWGVISGSPKTEGRIVVYMKGGGDKDFFLFLAWWVFLFNSHCPELRIWKKGYDRTRAISLASSTRWQEPSGKEGNWRRVGGGAAEEGRKEERDLWASEVDHCEASRVFTKFDVDFGFHNSIFDNIHPKNSRVPALCSQILCSPTLTLSPSLRLYAIHSAWWHSASVKSDCI